MNQLLEEAEGAEPTAGHSPYEAPHDSQYAENIKAEMMLTELEAWPYRGHEVLQRP